eukprot:Nitzschia sp. Nitz4//scaffold387_size12074//3359//7349//NITZ4_009001-RA/size12074-augustus-gene-0.7-mRNA-1//1//CDS//3329549970//2779//frame0
MEDYNYTDYSSFVPSLAPTEASMTTFESWIPLATSILLSLTQLAVFLLIFECSRRSKHVADVYDRRRVLWPDRVPPPLMQHRGCLGGYLGFEWYRVQCANPEYTEMAKAEYQKRLLSGSVKWVDPNAHRNDPKKRISLTSLSTGMQKRRTKENAKNRFLVEAEKMCQEEEPFYVPDSTDSLDFGVEQGSEMIEFNYNSDDHDDNANFRPPLSSEPDESEASFAVSFSADSMNDTFADKTPVEFNDILGKVGVDDDPHLEYDEFVSQLASVEKGERIPTSIDNGNLRSPEKVSPTFDPKVAVRETIVETSNELPDDDGSDHTAPAANVDSSQRGIPAPAKLERHVSYATSDSESEKGSGVIPSSSQRGRRTGIRRRPGRSNPSRKKSGQALLDLSTSLHGKISSTIKPAMNHLKSDFTNHLSRIRRYTAEVSEWDTTTVTSFSSRLTKYVKKRVLKVTEGQDEEEESTPSSKHQSASLMKHTTRRPLSQEQAELLRCIGLDSFITLQFLDFGFEVAVWPFLVAVVLLLPAYATGGGTQVGYFTLTVSNISNGDDVGKLWLVVIFGYVQILYILRRLWVEWEIFLPLRNDFLEQGDFCTTKYKDQYRRTCLVEFVPRSHRDDKALYELFNALFPGEVHRTEILLNTENIRRMNLERVQHLEDYENAYAKRVSKMAQYLERLDAYNRGERRIEPKKPPLPRIIVKEMVEGRDFGNAFVHSTKKVKDARTYLALQYYYREVSRLNKEIEDEFIRLAQAKRRRVPRAKENIISRVLGFKYIFPRETGHVHSSTAFIEFNSLTAKQQAIQCNLTGINALLRIQPVPEPRDILWGNAHVARALIDRRKIYANVAMFGCLIAWSIAVASIRALQNSSGLFPNVRFLQTPLVATTVDTYVPALIVECAVRYIAFGIQYVAKWIRFKTISEADNFVLVWYFWFRLVTFVFVIVSGSLVDTGEDFFSDPTGFIKDVSENAVLESEFFISYILVAGTIQVFFRFSQVHNVVYFWFLKKVTKEEAVSQRKLDRMRSEIRKFHLEEFIPLFLFIFMISALYGWIAPLSNLFVAVFFKLAYKVFKYMGLYIYGNSYEGGGRLFYSLTEMLFYLLYGLILLLSGYCSLFGTSAMTGVSAMLMFVTIGVHIGINRTFRVPSLTLPLTKAVEFDNGKDSAKGQAIRQFLRAKATLENIEREEREKKRPAIPKRGLSRGNHSKLDFSAVELGCGTDGSTSKATQDEDSEVIQEAIAKLERKYKEDDSMSELTGTTESGTPRDFFVYRQPALNRATWETVPRPYWEAAMKDYSEVTFW